MQAFCADAVKPVRAATNRLRSCPTHADVEHLLSVRDTACVSIYLPTELRHPV
jgi:hypothetical protein